MWGSERVSDNRWTLFIVDSLYEDQVFIQTFGLCLNNVGAVAGSWAFRQMQFLCFPLKRRPITFTQDISSLRIKTKKWNISTTRTLFPPLFPIFRLSTDWKSEIKRGGRSGGEPGEKGHQKPEFEVVGRSVILWTSYQLFIMFKITSFNMVIGILGI